MENWENNIEDEYQRRFEDFEEMPPDFLWDKIQPRIQEEKKRRGIIIWWPMGIAAALLLAFTLGYNYLKPVQKVEVSSRFEKPQNVNSDTSKTEINKNEKVENLQIEQNDIKQIAATSLPQNTQINQNREPKSTKLNISKEIKKESQFVENKGINVGNNTILAENFNEISERKKLESSFTELASIDKIKIGNPLSINHLEIAQPKEEPIFEADDEKVLAFIPPKEVFANISPMLNYYVISPNRNDNFLVKAFNGSEQRLGFAAQMGVVYQLNKRLSSRNALSYFTGKSKISYDVLHNEPQSITILNDHSVQINNTDLSHNEFKKWQYIELQSDLLYEIRKMQALSVGMKVGFQTENLNKPAIYARLGYRLSKPISNKIALWAEPSVALSLTSQSSVENLFAYRTTGFSLNIGASWLK